MMPIPMFGEAPPVQQRLPVSREDAADSILGQLERFLARHTGADDLGLRLWGRQLAAGVRFVRLVREGQYDLVVGNPPYQGTSKMVDAAYVKRHYPRGKADLYAAFLERGLELARPGGVSALLTMRNWMFIKQYANLRKWLLESWDLRVLGDFDRGAFEEVPDEVVSVVVSVFRRTEPVEAESIALQPTARSDRTRDSERTQRKRAAVICGVGIHYFERSPLESIPGTPVVYWWAGAEHALYQSVAKLGSCAYAREGLGTKDDTRFLRAIWEVHRGSIFSHQYHVDAIDHQPGVDTPWVPFIKGAAGREWVEGAETIVDWHLWGGRIAQFERGRYGRGAREYFVQGIAIKTMGLGFSARIHRYSSIIGHAGTSVYSLGADINDLLCQMNVSEARRLVSSFNPTNSFQVADVVRLPLLPIESGEYIVRRLLQSFGSHESHREPSIEFRRPGPSPWRDAQDWAQLAVDRPEGAPLPEYTEVLDPEPPTDHISFALGIALGRFGPNGEGILDPAAANLDHTLPAGVFFLDGTLPPTDSRDSLGHAATTTLKETWQRRRDTIETRHRNLRDYLRLDFFKEVHRKMYENRPIHWPLSSSKKTFVAWVTIHRMNERTLQTLLADHLNPAKQRLEGELPALREARDGADRKAARDAEKRLTKVQRWLAELSDFIQAVTTCAEQGPPPTGAGCPPRAADARYAPDLDDGVMINSAALWPLLHPQWKDPKKWWKELSTARGRKDYDWSHLARRYWPVRVDAKCRDDPSLGVAHGCFWRYHPARAWAWELRLQSEIEQTFRIEEAPYSAPGDDSPDGGHAALRAAYLENNPIEALKAVEKEALRRIGRGASKAAIPQMTLLESGLWTTKTTECRELEQRIKNKQDAPFQLNAPDAPEGRAPPPQSEQQPLLPESM